MKAAMYHGLRDIRIEDVPEPDPILSPHAVLLRPLYAGICGSDVHEYASGPTLLHADPVRLDVASTPQILGHEFSAEVVATGNDVGETSAGDLVAVRPGTWCGRCVTCLSGFPTSCPHFSAIGIGARWGGLAELAVVDADQVTVMPTGVSPQQAALLEPTGVAMHAFRQSGVEAGGRLLVTGGGPIGALVALFAHAAGVSDIIISEPNPQRRQLIDDLQVADCIDPLDGAHGELEDVDGCVEASGHWSGLDLCLRAVRPGGTIVQAGLHKQPPTVAMPTLNQKQARIVGSWCWPLTGWDRMARLVAAGRLPVEKLITAEIELDDLVERGLEALIDPAANHQKILIRIAAAG